MNKVLRKRTAFIWLLPIVILAILWMYDPDEGASTKLWVLTAITTALLVSFAFWWDKGITDYPEADTQELFRTARTAPVGAGLALVARAIRFAVLVWAFVFAATYASKVGAQDVSSFVPARCMELQPAVNAAIEQHWRTHPDRALIPALIEHESCVALTHSRCCNPKSRLKSAREEGAGLGQITRAYRADGSVRFDALQEMVDRHPVLRGWGWDNVYDRADYQIAAVVLKSRDNYLFFVRFVPEDFETALQFGDAGYNGGNGGVQNDRRMCVMKAGCNPKKWFGHVEHTCSKSNVALYGKRSACDINRHHVKDVTQTRAPKYRRLL